MTGTSRLSSSNQPVSWQFRCRLKLRSSARCGLRWSSAVTSPQV